MTGQWIGGRWWQYRADRSAEYNRLSRKFILLLANSDRCQAGAMIRLRLAYIRAAEIVSQRIDILDERRLAA